MFCITGKSTDQSFCGAGDGIGVCSEARDTAAAILSVAHGGEEVTTRTARHALGRASVQVRLESASHFSEARLSFIQIPRGAESLSGHHVEVYIYPVCLSACRVGKPIEKYRSPSTGPMTN